MRHINMMHDPTKTHNNVKGLLEDEFQYLRFRFVNAMMQTEDDDKMDKSQRKQIVASSYNVVTILVMTNLTIIKNGK